MDFCQNEMNLLLKKFKIQEINYLTPLYLLTSAFTFLALLNIQFLLS